MVRLRQTAFCVLNQHGEQVLSARNLIGGWHLVVWISLVRANNCCHALRSSP